MKQITILLADDHVVVRESIRRSLDSEPDFKVVGEANNGEEVVRMAMHLKPDVIIMDISMPKLNGIDATKKIKASCPLAKILILTAYDYEQYIFPLLEAGVTGYLLKDVSSRELVNAIKSVNKGDIVLHPEVTRKVLWRFQQERGGRVGDYKPNLPTERQIAVLNLAARGISNKSIAKELHLSVRTIESHLGTIFNKLGVDSRTEAVIQAIKKGWITLEQLP